MDRIEDRFYPSKVDQKIIQMLKDGPDYSRFFFEEGVNTLGSYINSGWRIKRMIEDRGRMAVIMEKAFHDRF